MFVAIGFSGVNQARRDVYEQCKTLGYELITYVNSKATHWGELEIGDNCFIFEENVIQPNVRIGSNVILWSGNHIGHDSTIEDHVFVASHAVISGNVTIGESSFVGVNATFRDAIRVAPRCVIGAGALIMKDTLEGAVYSVRGTEPLEKKSWELENF
jgi:sugar O-acyltransferase (sialic acid O-acetyltransferase NeuD family)